MLAVLMGKTGGQVEVWLGSHGREGQDGQKIPVKRIIIRPDYQAPTCARSVCLTLTGYTTQLNKNITNNYILPPGYIVVTNN